MADDAETRTSPPARGLGWKRTEHDPRDLKARALFGAPRNLPGEARELEGCVPGVLDQLDTSSCVGNAIAAAVDTRLRRMGRWDAPLSSRQAIYTVARALERTDPDEELVDDGSIPRLAMRGIRGVPVEGGGRVGGIPSEASWPFDPSRINDELPWDVHQRAHAFRVDKFWRIDSAGKQRVEDVCQALAAGYPVVFGTDVDSRFLRHQGTEPVGPADQADVQGGHMMFFVGYTTDGAKRVLRGVNSWGIGWGDRGFYWANEEFVMDPALDDLYVMQIAE